MNSTCLVGSVGLAVRSKHLISNMTSSSSKDSIQRPLLNANAATVLSEIGLSEEDNHPAPIKPTKRPSVGATKTFNPGRQTKNRL